MRHIDSHKTLRTPLSHDHLSQKPHRSQPAETEVQEYGGRCSNTAQWESDGSFLKKKKEWSSTYTTHNHSKKSKGEDTQEYLDVVIPYSIHPEREKS